MSASSPRQFKAPKDKVKAEAKVEDKEFIELQGACITEVRLLKENANLLGKNGIEVPEAILGLEKEFAKRTTVEGLDEVFGASQEQWRGVIRRLEELDAILKALEGLRSIQAELKEHLKKEAVDATALHAQVELLYKIMGNLVTLPVTTGEAKEIMQLREGLSAEVHNLETVPIATPNELQAVIQRVQGRFKGFVQNENDNENEISDLAVSALQGFRELRDEFNAHLAPEAADAEVLLGQVTWLGNILSNFYKMTPSVPIRGAPEIDQLREGLSAEMKKLKIESIATPDNLQAVIDRVRGHFEKFVRFVDVANGEKEKNIGSKEKIEANVINGVSGSSVKLRNYYKGSVEKALEKLATNVQDLKKYLGKFEI